MQFDFSPEQILLKSEVQRLLADRCPRTAVRAALEGTRPFDRDLWLTMGAMGFIGAAIPESYGGAGGGYLELCAIAEELGRALAPTPMAASIYLAAEFLLVAGSEAQKATHLPRLSSGEWVGTFACAEGVGRMTPNTIEATVTSGRLSGRKAPVPAGEVADVAVIAARDAEGNSALSLFLVDLRAAGVSRGVLEVIDPTCAQSWIEFDGVPCQRLGASAEGGPIMNGVFDRAAVLVAFEQIGGADCALEMARDYALERMAFGRPIGSFQAIKHMLADMYVSAQLARSNAYYGAWALSTNAPELPVAAATARVSATQAFQHCAKNNIQVHGGMGFTWELDCHLFYRRSNHLALLLGSPSAWEDALIERMLDHREQHPRASAENTKTRKASQDVTP